ncbi:MAG: PaaI family thioesterase [Immundisolibacteraceae bacterium]|nr:PaaI family thioesterase [Immundisolibacteraceae bacterium]
MTNQAMEIFSRDAYSAHLGIELIESADGNSLVKMPIQPFHLNGGGRVHGGALLSLADFALAAAAISRGDYGSAVSVQMNFMKGAGEGTLWARGEELSQGRSIRHYRVTVEDDAQTLIGSFQGTVYLMQDPSKLLNQKKPG